MHVLNKVFRVESIKTRALSQEQQQSNISGKITNTVNAKNNTNRIIEHENAIEWRASNSSPLYFIALCRVIPIPHSVGIVQKHQYRSDSLASFGWCETKHARVSSCCCCVLKVLEPSDNDKSLIRSYSAAPAAYARFTGWFDPGFFSPCCAFSIESIDWMDFLCVQLFSRHSQIESNPPFLFTLFQRLFYSR